MYPQQPEQPPPHPDAQDRTRPLPPAGRQPDHQPYPPTHSYPPVQPYPPQPYYAPPAAHQPYPPASGTPGRQRRTEFGWASIVVGGIALVTSWIPYVGWFVMGAVAVLVSLGLFGRYERSPVPAIIGAALLGLSVLLHFVVWDLVQSWITAFEQLNS